MGALQDGIVAAFRALLAMEGVTGDYSHQPTLTGAARVVDEDVVLLRELTTDTGPASREHVTPVGWQAVRDDLTSDPLVGDRFVVGADAWKVISTQDLGTGIWRLVSQLTRLGG